MNNIDKYIKLNFSFIKGEMVGLFCCAVMFFVGVFLPSLMPILFGVVVAVIVILVKIYIKIFYKSLFGEEAHLYQTMPVSTDQMIVAKIFVVMVAFLIFQAGMYMGLATGGTMVLTTETYGESFRALATAVSGIGNLEVILFVLASVIEAFGKVAMVFALITIYNTLLKGTAGKLLMIAGYFIIVNVEDKLIPSGIEKLIGSNFYIDAVVVMIVSILLGVASCMIIKNCLEKKYVA